MRFAAPHLITRRAFVALATPILFVLIFAAQIARAADAAIPFITATVEGKGDTFTVQWSAPGVSAVTLYTGPNPGEIERFTPVGKGGSDGKVTITLPPAPKDSPRRYFELVPDKGQPLVIADRVLHLATSPNARDVGGYRTKDGKWVRMGMLYRTDQLNLLSDADLGVLSALKIRMVCDLRTDDERKSGPDRLPPFARPLIADVTGANPNSVLADILKKPNMVRDAGPEKMEKAMADVYRQLVNTKTAQDAYTSMFQRLADPAWLPGLFHCTAGKDRTGWATAVFLSIMGVPRETIMADYLASNALLTEKNKRALDAMPDPAMRTAMEPLTGVREVYLNAAFEEVEKSFGTMDNYLTKGLRLDDKTQRLLRRLYSAG
jgi:protein-tyrosine phosphatase